jgi:hypothetical protein
VRAAPLLAALLATTVIAGSSAPASAEGGLQPAVSAPAACGQSSDARPVIRHVIIIVMENHSLSSIQGHAPFLNALAKRCGSAINYHAISHPSLPNYLAMTSGSFHRIHSDCSPQRCSQPGPNIFSQLSRHGLRWRSYAESMPVACDMSTAGLFAARHVPDASGDKWLRTWIPMIVASRTYRHGHTAILITFDEGSGSNVVPLVVVSRYTRPHTVSHRLLSHYSLLRASERLLGMRRYLGKARSARGLPKAFHL